MLTQEELGQQVGVSKQAVNNWENDRRLPRANDIVALCRVLGCTSDYLLEMVDSPNERWC
jgi:transcriptional regulator with XRE-family HTH domain